MFDLTGKIALVTGASRGIGRGVALALATAGADVAINYVSNEAKAQAVVEEITALGRRAMAVRADVTDEAQVKAMFSQVTAHFGRLDILVANAGTTQPKDIFQMELADWQRIVDVNLTSAYLCAKCAMEIMREQKSGRIIFMASQAGERGALYGHAHYAAAKSGVLALSKTVARTAAPLGITVNSIAPGVIFTEMTGLAHNDEEIADLTASIPPGLGTPEDIGAGVVYLASDEARYVTGITLDINGGSYIH